MKTTYQTGIRGEDLAEKYLTGLGMTCLEKRYREKCGEIDLILLDGDTVVFAEVKTRVSPSEKKGIGLQAVNYRKQKRIADCATLYLMRRKWLNRNIRFDVIEVNADGVIHIPNAFQPGGMIFR